MNAERIRENKLYVVRGRGVARCVMSGGSSMRPTMLWMYEEPVAPEDIVREAAKDDVPPRFHKLLFASGAP